MWQGANLCALSGGINIRKKIRLKEIEMFIATKSTFSSRYWKKAQCYGLQLLLFTNETMLSSIHSCFYGNL
jgi:hypothetical protein